MRIVVVALVLMFFIVALVPQLFAAAKKTPGKTMAKGHTYEECVALADSRMMGGGKDSSGRRDFIANCQKGTQR